MSFTSFSFAVFLALILVLYYLPPLRKFQVLILVAGSILFYAYDQWRLLPLLLVAVLGTYACLVLAMRGRAIGLWMGIAFNLGVLGFFKYKFLFVTAEQKAHTGIDAFNFLLMLPLPIGISFFVFHNISMLVDFTKSRETVEKPTLGEAFLYIIFFPQLVSGPITRARGFFPQITEKYLSDVDYVSAAKWIISGYFMKLFCANNLGQFTSYMDPPLFEKLHGLDRILLLFLYSFQIYADFFGYSAIAIGLAILFGYRLPLNFNRPYLASSFSDFWTRWHISLSTWLRNYLYFPLGGNRHGATRTYLNLVTVMALGGLWHGAALSYVVWGLVHGLLLAIERPFLTIGQSFCENTPAWLSSVSKCGRILLVFCLVSGAWMFFKLPHFEDAITYMRGIPAPPVKFGLGANFYCLAALYSAPVVMQHLLGWVSCKDWFRRLEPAFYAMLVFLATIEAGPNAPFIYFQF